MSVTSDFQLIKSLTPSVGKVAAESPKKPTPRHNMNQPFGLKGPENSLVPLGSGRKRSTVRDLSESSRMEEKALETELGFYGPRAELRELVEAEFQRACGGKRSTMDPDLFVESVSQTWWLNRRSAFACFNAAVPEGAEGRMTLHQYLLLREAFVHGENAEHPVIKKLRLSAIWQRRECHKGHCWCGGAPKSQVCIS